MIYIFFNLSTQGFNSIEVIIFYIIFGNIKEPLLLIGKSSPCGSQQVSSLAIWVVLYHTSHAI